MDKVIHSKNIDLLTKLVKAGLIIMLGITVIITVMSVVAPVDKGEASIGSFGSKKFNTGWTMTCKGSSREIDLPMYVDAEPGEEIIISNRLPANLSDGMSLMFRSSMQDVTVYVDGRLREEYSSKAAKGMGYYIPSAWIVTDLRRTDSGRDISIHITVKNKGSLNEVSLSHGNNVWFAVIKDSLLINALAFIELIAGAVAFLAAVILGKKYKTEATGYLGMLMVDVAIWMISESTLRQIYFTRPSMSQYFSYMSLELLGALACMYFDAVQHRVYHVRYLIIEGIVLIQIIINTLLHMTGTLEFYQTMPITHVWEAVCGIVVISCIVTDIAKKRIRSYWISAIGSALFVLFCLIELFAFYFSKFRNHFGLYICIALLLLLACTLIQMVNDVLALFHERERIREDMINTTVETIAGAIDARDENTGGHSERVGYYASELAREVAGTYGLSEEDVLRIRYIGLVHDIGKIGVADSVLNKAGKLTSEEFSLMKRHTEIGYEIMSSMGEEVDGMLDGIRHHHERFDGTGYPDSLAGEDIPLVARILCLADSYDAMTSNRVYRKRLTNDEVKNELNRCAGTQFDPNLAKAFVALLNKGDLREGTVEGMAVGRDGKLLESALLEDRLQSDLLDNARIIHASHVRMLCYIIKLMEKKGKMFEVMFIGPEDPGSMTDGDLSSARKKISSVINANICNHDVHIRYSEEYDIVALYERSDEEIQGFKDTLKNAYPKIRIRDLAG